VARKCRASKPTSGASSSYCCCNGRSRASPGGFSCTCLQHYAHQSRCKVGLPGRRCVCTGALPVGTTSEAPSAHGRPPGLASYFCHLRIAPCCRRYLYFLCRRPAWFFLPARPVLDWAGADAAWMLAAFCRRGCGCGCGGGNLVDARTARRFSSAFRSCSICAPSICACGVAIHTHQQGVRLAP